MDVLATAAVCVAVLAGLAATATALTTEAAAEGLNAFADKRAPRFPS